MSENNALEKLFTAGLTKEQFIQRYNELKYEEEGKQNTSSIFKGDMSNTLGALFDTLNNSTGIADDKLSDEEINVLKNYVTADGKDGENVLSEEDMAELYEKTIQNILTKYSSESPDKMYKAAVTDGGVKPSILGETAESAYLSGINSQIDAVNQLAKARKDVYTSRMSRYRSELDALYMTSHALMEDEKTAKKTEEKIKQKEQQLKEKEDEIRDKEAELDAIENEIKYAKSMNPEDMDENTLKNLQTKYDNLKEECEKLLSKINELNSDIDKLRADKLRKVSDITLKRQGLLDKKNQLEHAMQTEETNYKNDIGAYAQQLQTLKAMQDYAIEQSAPTSYSKNYSDSDTSAPFTGNAQDLKNIWHKSHPHLTDRFYNKVIAVSDRLGCDPNALMAIMNSESGIKANAQNPTSSATGLIQFMPKTAQALGTSTTALRQMSAEQQLVYVEKCFMMSKKIAGFKPGEKISQGQLYALVFLPAYAKRDVLTVSGHKYYIANKGLDMDKDGKITIQDLNARVEKMKPKSIRKA